MPAESSATGRGSRTWARVEELAWCGPRANGRIAAARREGARILALVNERDRLVALDEGGRTRSTSSFAAWLAAHRDRDPRRLVFVVGRASGLAPEVLARAEETLSLAHDVPASRWPACC